MSHISDVIDAWAATMSNTFPDRSCCAVHRHDMHSFLFKTTHASHNVEILCLRRITELPTEQS